MKKAVLFLSMIFLLNACYQDDIDDLKRKYDELKAEQERQAELLATYQTLLQALENKLTISAILNTDNGYKIVFSNGAEMEITNGHTPVITIGENGNWYIDGVDSGKKSTGQDGISPQLTIVDGYWYLDDVNTGVKAEGADGSDAPYIVSIVDMGGVIVFYMSDGTNITMEKTEILGLYVLSEGTMGNGNGQLVYYDYNATTGKYERNNEKRFQNYGDTPNDLLIYGSKMYCAITGSSLAGGLVRIINPASGETIRDISLSRESVTLQPRRLTALGSKIYVTLYSGAVAWIDTASYATDIIPLSGTYTEGICADGQTLYICNSGQGEGNTVSVVNTATFTETETITVPYNPVNILNAGNNELYLNTASVLNGPATGNPANLYVLSTASKQITHTFNLAVESIAIGRNHIYGAATNWEDYGGILKKITIANKSVSDFTTVTNKLMFAYKLSVHPVTGEVFLTQQMGQEINRFKADGTHIETLRTGQQNGATVVFVNKAK
ncbi:MAG: hypothetical protein LBD80_05775 [Tannerella sp.]|jgi:YVTN family beta-propeller protein|nr:hypothetical protein [Tannerella sp.]